MGLVGLDPVRFVLDQVDGGEVEVGRLLQLLDAVVDVVVDRHDLDIFLGECDAYFIAV